MVKCDPYQEGEGGFGYSNTPSCETAGETFYIDKIVVTNKCSEIVAIVCIILISMAENQAYDERFHDP